MSSTLGAPKKSSVLFQWNLIGGKLGAFMLDRFNLKERHQYPLSLKIGGHQSRCWWVCYEKTLVIDRNWIPGHPQVVSYLTVD
jgi:hypothetical protein